MGSTLEEVRVLEPGEGGELLIRATLLVLLQYVDLLPLRSEDADFRVVVVTGIL